MIKELPELPGLDILKKYNYSIIKEEGLITTVKLSGIVPHYDRQRLFAQCWQQNLEEDNVFSIDRIFSFRNKK